MLSLAWLDVVFAADYGSLGFGIVLILLLLSFVSLSDGPRRVPTRQLVSMIVRWVLGGADGRDHVQSTGLKDGLVWLYDARQAFTFRVGVWCDAFTYGMLELWKHHFFGGVVPAGWGDGLRCASDLLGHLIVPRWSVVSATSLQLLEGHGVGLLGGMRLVSHVIWVVSRLCTVYEGSWVGCWDHGWDLLGLNHATICVSFLQILVIVTF